ncbi:MAG: LPP20 family lipoprotein [Nitrospirota bacterium]|nr:LPP20 family lipoprotein [Nitrospirota bacterium]
MKRLTVIACAFFTLLTPGGCAWVGQNKPPAWILGPSKDYPPDQYLTGVGQADAQDAANDRAYGAVAKIFKAEVTAQARDWESFLQFENRGTTAVERRLTLDHVTNVSTDKVLENVRIMSGWSDDKTGQHYALAVMNRAQAGTAMLGRIGELDDTVETELKEFRQAQDKLAKLRHLRRAIKSLVLREAHNADLRIIRQSGQGAASTYKVAELTAELEQFMATNLAISVDVSGTQAEPVRRAVMEGLIREGLPVLAAPLAHAATNGQTGGEAGDSPLVLLAKGTVRLWNANVPDPRFRYVRWCSDFVVVEADSQRVVGAVSRSGKEGHLTEGEAAAKAVRVMQQELTSELAKTLAGYVYGEVDAPTAIPPAACPRDEGR